MMDLANQKFGLLTAVEIHSRKKVPGGTVLFWRCLCECGNEAVVRAAFLKNGNTKSCGCLKRRAGLRTKTHGMSKSKTYQLWCAMVQRARGHRAESYVDRGIGMCERWLKFESFLEDMGHPPGGGYSLERIDNNLGYEPGNCKWLPMSEQWRNRSTTALYDYEGRKLSLREISEVCGVKEATLRHRLKVQGMSLEAATVK